MKSKAQLKFEEQRKDLTDREIMMEILYANYLSYRSSEAVRSNTSKLVWFVVIGIILSIVSALIGFGAAAATI
ncbi:hypothetical protein [Flagellimonas marinaquae]|uniref:hypothetical protein n=1 Tax=Flagellimonas marinaquae TaxID=254955 RepID=UPI00207614CC|nr:hypothetical protein [Allomuricauda aquimarina]USD26859.1 hypothetical protein MJO53_08170 [Allomuricauda aquimarina]